MSKNKIKKYFKLQRELDKLNKKEKELRNIQDDIFMSKFKTNGIFADAQGIFDVFLENPEKEFDRWDAMRRASWRWSEESQRNNINKIFKVLFNEKFIVRTGGGYYKINPEFLHTIKRNKKGEKNEV